MSISLHKISANGFHRSKFNTKPVSIVSYHEAPNHWQIFSSGDDWTDCFHVDGISLPSNLYLGFSAMTGDVADAHECVPLPLLQSSFFWSVPSIITVNTYSAILSAPDAPRGKHRKTGIFGGSKEEKGTWMGFFFKLFLLAGVCTGGFYGYKEYQRRQIYAGSGNFGGSSRGGGYGNGMYSNSKRF